MSVTAEMVEPGIQRRTNKGGDVTFRAYLGRVDGVTKYSPAQETIEAARAFRDAPEEEVAQPAPPPAVVSTAELVNEASVVGLFSAPGPWPGIVARGLHARGLEAVAVSVAGRGPDDAQLGALFLAHTMAGLGWQEYLPGPSQIQVLSACKAWRDVGAVLTLLVHAALFDSAVSSVDFDLVFALSSIGAGGDPSAKYAMFARGGTR